MWSGCFIGNIKVIQQQHHHIVQKLYRTNQQKHFVSTTTSICFVSLPSVMIQAISKIRSFVISKPTKSRKCMFNCLHYIKHIRLSECKIWQNNYFLVDYLSTKRSGNIKNIISKLQHLFPASTYSQKSLWNIPIFSCTWSRSSCRQHKFSQKM